MGKPAARVGDMHVCPMVTGIVPHVGGPVLPPGAITVLIGSLPSAVMGGMCTCVGPPDLFPMGSTGVFIGGRPAVRAGDLTAHGGSVVPGLPTVLIGEVMPPAGFSGPLTPEQAALLFEMLASLDFIAFKYPRDGCYARAQIMCNIMKAMGVNCGKVWSFASNNNDPLWVSTGNVPEGKVEWGYHVAPTVQVANPDGTTQTMVIDPSTANRPVSQSDWVANQHDNPSVVNTKLNEAPTGVGSGYWPSPDPAEGPDLHAFDTMEDYKMKEGE